jgi:hypothetical protein
MSKFLFRLDNFKITDTMARHLDTDWVYFTVRVGDQVFGPRHQKIGDLNNGTYTLNWDLGPVTTAPNTPVVMTYQIINHGHDDTKKQVSDDIAIATTIAQLVAVVALGTGAEIVSKIGGALKEVGGWLFGGPNCDGVVLSDAISTSGAILEQWTHGSAVHSVSRHYKGPETPHGCGADAEYNVTWSVHRIGPQVPASDAVISNLSRSGKP